MKLIKHILVAFDFSECSMHALRQAVDFAKHFDAKISVVHVLDRSLLNIYGLTVKDNTEKDVIESINTKIAELGAASYVHSVDVFVGDPYFFIVAKAQTLPADLVVIGSHGRQGVKRLLFGSVAEKVVKLSPVPVLVSRSDVFPVNCKILVPVDDSKYSEDALSFAQLFAQSSQAQIQILNAVDVPSLIFGGEINFNDIINERVEFEQKRLDGLARKFNLKEAPLVLEGMPVDVVKQACDNDPKIKLVILSTHSKTDLSHILLGGFSSKIVRYCPVSVLAIKPDEIKSELHERVVEDIKKSGSNLQ